MNENDENGPSTRLTRAKAAALSSENVSAAGAAAKKPLQTKKSTTNTTTGVTRRRALGDVSNVSKNENGEAKDAKKPAASKVGLNSKATSQIPQGGVQKLTRNNASRTALG